MSQRRRPLPLVIIGLVCLVALAVTIAGCASRTGASATSAATAGSGAIASRAPGSPAPGSPAPGSPAPGSLAPSGRPTAAPRATGSPSAAFAEFIARLQDDRTTVERLDHDLSTATQGSDPEAVRVAAVAILDFVDTERDWLAAHPPADCYADAHAASGAMLDAYSTAAERFVDWSTATGLDGLAALARAADAAQTAQATLTSLGSVLDRTRCAT